MLMTKNALYLEAPIRIDPCSQIALVHIKSMAIAFDYSNVSDYDPLKWTRSNKICSRIVNGIIDESPDVDYITS